MQIPYQAEKKRSGCTESKILRIRLKPSSDYKKSQALIKSPACTASPGKAVLAADLIMVSKFVHLQVLNALALKNQLNSSESAVEGWCTSRRDQFGC